MDEELHVQTEDSNIIFDEFAVAVFKYGVVGHGHAMPCHAMPYSTGVGKNLLVLFSRNSIAV